jgi:tripartite ATP-independent transporter DctM subunit
VRWKPELGPPAERVPWPERWAALRGVIPVMLIAVTVVGGIYGGVFTPTESAAVGVVATLAVGFARRSLSLRQLREAVEATAETTAMIFVILLGAAVFNAFLALTQAPDLLAIWISEQDLPPYAILAALLVTYIVLGAVMDELAMILLTLPIFFPVVMALDFGLDTSEETAIWFGILVLIVVGIGLTTPPIGLNVFVVSGLSREVSIGRIFRGVMPFLAADMVKLAICAAFPGLSLLLVRLLA